MNVDLTNQEIALCVVALGDAANTVRDGGYASANLGMPINFEDFMNAMLALKAKLEALATEPSEDQGEDVLGERKE